MIWYKTHNDNKTKLAPANKKLRETHNVVRLIYLLFSTFVMISCWHG